MTNMPLIPTHSQMTQEFEERFPHSLNVQHSFDQINEFPSEQLLHLDSATVSWNDGSIPAPHPLSLTQAPYTFDSGLTYQSAEYHHGLPGEFGMTSDALYQPTECEYDYTNIKYQLQSPSDDFSSAQDDVYSPNNDPAQYYHEPPYQSAFDSRKPMPYLQDHMLQSHPSNPYSSYPYAFQNMSNGIADTRMFEAEADSSEETDGTDSAEKGDSTPYAQLIYAALMSAPNHRMILKDIYHWIEENTDKAKDPSFSGWQNSVRHNLSMNKARSSSLAETIISC